MNLKDRFDSHPGCSPILNDHPILKYILSKNINGVFCQKASCIHPLLTHFPIIKTSNQIQSVHTWTLVYRGENNMGRFFFYMSTYGVFSFLKCLASSFTFFYHSSSRVSNGYWLCIMGKGFLKKFCWFLYHVAPLAECITKIGSASAPPYMGPYFVNASSLGHHPTHKARQAHKEIC
jgi:hypothetical protein